MKDLSVDPNILSSDNLCVVEKIEVYKINIKESVDNEVVVVMTRRIAKKAGFKQVDEVMIATSASELATNIVRYASCGQVIISIIGRGKKKGLEIIAIDEGPGIPNIELAMQEGFTTTKKSLGLGLSSVKNIMDDFSIQSQIGKGTHIVARKWYR